MNTLRRTNETEESSPCEGPFITGRQIYLRKLSMEDARADYLGWLNDPEVLRYRAGQAFPSNMNDLRCYIERVLDTDDLYLAICMRETRRHVGGISLTNINLVHRNANLNIMIGDRSVWGKGIGKEAIWLLAKHGFAQLNLHKICAQSPNPAFNHIVKGQGWTHEGSKREMIWSGSEYLDLECYGILKSEFDAREYTYSFE